MTGCLHINSDLVTNIPQYSKHTESFTPYIKHYKTNSTALSVFLDVSQAFDKVWHVALLFKIKKVFPIQYFRLLKSYLSDREFRTRVNEKVSSQYTILSGVPQGSVLGPVLYVLYTTDLPTSVHTTTGTFADDTVILARHDDPVTASHNLQGHLDQLEA
jgi:hypothetical protein